MISSNTLFFGGIEKTATAEALVKKGAAGMMSQLEYSDDLLADCKDIPLVFDSGAFSMLLEDEHIEKYAALIQRIGTRALWYANADRIGDQERSEQNYHYLLSLIPQELHPRILWIYQASAPISYLHRGIREHVQIGIGGLVPLFQSPDKLTAYRRLREIATIIAESGNPIVPHYLGLSTLQAIQELRGYHPIFSVDSTTWLVGGKYGRAVTRNGSQRDPRADGYDLDTEELLSQNIRVMSRWMEPSAPRRVISPYEQVSWLKEVAV